MSYNTLQIITAALSSIILFLYGLEHFGSEIQKRGRYQMTALLKKWTDNRVLGFTLGTIFTGLIQSSSAVSSLVISLVDGKIITFARSLPILIGTNVGTVVTAQLVAFKLTAIGPFFIVLGFFFDFFERLKVFGKALFYFGFILFALDLVSHSLTVLNTEFELKNYLLLGQSVASGIFYGAFFTMLVQSSSITTGLIIVFVQQGFLEYDLAIPMILGSNIGTTTTGLIVAARMGKVAKKTALANLVLKLVGVLIFLPFLDLFIQFINFITEDVVQKVAQAHLWFNLTIAIVFLVFLKQFELSIDWIWSKIGSTPEKPE